MSEPRTHSPQVPRWQRAYQRQGLLYILPAVLLFGVMVAYPIARALCLSLMDFSIIEPQDAKFVGLANYARLFTQEVNLKPFWNTLVFTGMFIPPFVIISLLLAVMLNRIRRGSAVLRSMIFAPVVVSLAVSAVMWALFYDQTFGLATKMIVGLGLLEIVNQPGMLVLLFAVLFLLVFPLYRLFKSSGSKLSSVPPVAGMAFGAAAAVWLITCMVQGGPVWISSTASYAGQLNSRLGLVPLPDWSGSFFGVPRALIDTVNEPGSFVFLFVLVLGASLLARMIIKKVSGRVPEILRSFLFLGCVSLALTAAVWVVTDVLQGNSGWIHSVAGVLGRHDVANLPETGILGSTSTAMPAIVVMAVWNGLGINVILFLVGLGRIPDEMYEAASVDGAGPVQRFFKVTLPQLRPMTYLIVLLSVIDALKVFGQPYIMTAGGPQDSTRTYVMHLYMLAFRSGQFQLGQAAAMAYLLALFIFLMSLLMRRFNKAVD